MVRGSDRRGRLYEGDLPQTFPAVVSAFEDAALRHQLLQHELAAFDWQLLHDFELESLQVDIHPPQTQVATQLDAKHPSAAASLREGLEDMFTVGRLGVPDRLARSLTPRWSAAWVGVGMLEAERSFRRVKGCKDMAILVTPKAYDQVA